MSKSTVRQRNLRNLIKDAGGPTPLAHRLGHAGPSYLSQLANAHRPITEKTARKLEHDLGLPDGYLDEDVHAADKPLPACPNMLKQVVLAVSEELDTQHAKVEPARLAQLVALVYLHAQPLGKVDKAYVQQVVQLTH